MSSVDTSSTEADAAMTRYAAGEDGAFEQVYDLVGPRLYRFLMRACHDVAAAEDLVQQTFLQLHRARGRFIPGAQVTPWAFSIARRLLIDELRRRQRAPSDDDGLQDLLAHEAGADAVVHAQQLGQRLAAAFATLSAPQQEAFRLVRQDGLTQAEAAQALGTTVMAVKLRLHRAGETLRAALGEPAAAGER